MKLWSLMILIGATAYGVSEGASARNATEHNRPIPAPAQMPLYGVTEAPIGHVKFCIAHPDDCRLSGRTDATVVLTTKRWEELTAINRRVNVDIKPMSDQAQYGVVENWTYPDSGKGDCEDYVLLKKRKLMELGWPAGALLITVVRDENDEGHAVLTVHADRGDLILDNKHSRILAWSDTHYTYIKRQSALDPRSWDSLVPIRIGPTIAASGADARK